MSFALMVIAIICSLLVLKHSINSFSLYSIPTVTGVLSIPTPTTFLPATDTVYCCTREPATVNVC